MPARRTASALVVCLAATVAAAQAPTKTGFVDRVCKAPGGGNRKYVVFVPADYNANPDKKYPVIMFLHGSGEGGDDGKAQVGVGMGPSVAAKKATFPFVVVFPQFKDRWNADSADGRRTMVILDEVLNDYRTDPKRVSLTGVSMGGMAVWQYAALHPARWAAIVPVCGTYNHAPLKADLLRDVPCWCFHGAKDQDAPIKESRAMIDQLKAAGGKPLFTVDKEGTHSYGYFNSVYGNDKLYEWLARQERWAPAADQPVGKKLLDAHAALDAAMAAHRADVAKWFEADGKVTADERTAYRERGALPARAPAALRAAPVKAAKAAAAVYRAAADEFTAMNKPEWGRAVLRELEGLKAAPGVGAAMGLPVGAWQFKYKPGPVTGTTTVAADWTAQHADSTGLKQTGTVQMGRGGYVIRYPRFVEVWAPSADGKAVEIEHYQPAADYPKFEPTATATGTRK